MVSSKAVAKFCLRTCLVDTSEKFEIEMVHCKFKCGPWRIGKIWLYCRYFFLNKQVGRGFTVMASSLLRMSVIRDKIASFCIAACFFWKPKKPFFQLFVVPRKWGRCLSTSDLDPVEGSYIHREKSFSTWGYVQVYSFLQVLSIFKTTIWILNSKYCLKIGKSL